MTEEEDERSHVAYVLEKRSTDRGHNKVRPSTNKEESSGMASLKRQVSALERSSLDRPQGNQQGEGSSKGQLDHLIKREHSQKSPSTEPLDVPT